VKHLFRAGEATASLDVTRSGDRLRIDIAGKTRDVVVLRAEGGRLDLLVDGRPLRAAVAVDSGKCYVLLPTTAPVVLEEVDPRARKPRARAGSGDDTLTATMHGQVVAVLAKPGDLVERGQALVVIEAMKMEMRLAAPHAGRVKAVSCKVGELVERGRVLVALEAATPPTAS
jgi:biotin carboxyl carrier protein